jgi:BolA family transcriptional regulator, general stress-responsive regulator
LRVARLDIRAGAPQIGRIMTVADTIRDKLARSFAPLALDVADESHLHAGHAGAREGGETHFRVVIVSAAFAGQGRIARHRAVHDALAEELAGGVHALSVTARTPDEAAARSD